MICCGMALKRMEMLRVSVREMKALIAKGRQNLNCFVY